MRKHPLFCFGDYSLLSTFRSQLMGLAMLWVMLFHSYEYHFDLLLIDEIKSLGFSGVDVFLLLSGLGIYTSISSRKSEPFTDYFYRRCRKILPTYWIVVFFYSIWLHMQGRISFSVMAWSLSTFHYWFHIPGSFNWYIPVLLLFYALAPWYARQLQSSAHPGWMTVLVFPFSYFVYRFSIPLELNYMEDFFFRLPTFAVGMLIGHFLHVGIDLSPAHLRLWLLGACCGIALAFLRWKHMLYISTCCIINCCLLPSCLLVAQLLRFCPIVFHRALSCIGNSSLEIYLLNVVCTREFPLLASYFPADNHCAAAYLILNSVTLLLGISLHRLRTFRKSPA